MTRRYMLQAEGLASEVMARRRIACAEVYTDSHTRSMSADRMLRVSDRTHAGFREETRRRGVTIDQVAAAALRALRQREMGAQLAEPLTDDEVEWLDAPLG